MYYSWLDKAFKGIIVNRALESLQGGSYEIMFTFSLNSDLKKI